MIQFIHQQLLPLLCRLRSVMSCTTRTIYCRSILRVADGRGMHGKPDHAVVPADESLLDGIEFKFAGDLLAKCLPIGIGIVRMRVTKQSAGEKFLAAEAGDGADRFIDAQETSVGVNLGNADGGMFVCRRKPLVLLERTQTRSFERRVRPLARGDVEKAIHRAHQLALRIAEWVDVDGHDQRRAVGMFDDALDVAHRRSGREHLGNQRTLRPAFHPVRRSARCP